jgi:hypothetical protein
MIIGFSRSVNEELLMGRVELGERDQQDSILAAQRSPSREKAGPDA